MENETQTVETNIEETAVTPEPETTEQITEDQLADILAQAELLEQELEKEREEKENYKKAALLAKKELKNYRSDEEETSTPSVDVDSIADAVIARLQKQHTEEETKAQKLSRKVSELKLALQNKPQVSAQSSNQERSEVKNSYFSPEQESQLKARGADIEMVRLLQTDPAAYYKKLQEKHKRS